MGNRLTDSVCYQIMFFVFFFLAFPVTETVELLCPVFIIFHSLFIMLLTFFPTNNYLPW